MPMIGLPGTGASMRIVGAASASARSLDSEVMRFTRTRVRDDYLAAHRRPAVLIVHGAAILVLDRDVARLDLPARLDTELGDGRALGDRHDLRVDTERSKRLDDDLRAQLVVDGPVLDLSGFSEQV